MFVVKFVSSLLGDSHLTIIMELQDIWLTGGFEQAIWK